MINDEMDDNSGLTDYERLDEFETDNYFGDVDDAMTFELLAKLEESEQKHSCNSEEWVQKIVKQNNLANSYITNETDLHISHQRNREVFSTAITHTLKGSNNVIKNGDPYLGLTRFFTDIPLDSKFVGDDSVAEKFSEETEQLSAKAKFVVFSDIRYHEQPCNVSPLKKHKSVSYHHHYRHHRWKAGVTKQHHGSSHAKRGTSSGYRNPPSSPGSGHRFGGAASTNHALHLAYQGGEEEAKSYTSPKMLLYYFASAVKNIQFHVDDDIIDKLNYYYTSSIITVFAILVSAKQYVGYPIQCWVPATFTEPMEQYTENYCWVQNTYWLPLHDYIPQNYVERENRQIGYYQWVPFVLALEALLFYVPCIIWRLLSWQSGIHIQSLVQMACDSRLLDAESRHKALHTIATHVEEALHIKHQMGAGAKFKVLNLLVCTRSTGAAVTCLYLSIKFLYCINIVGQIFLLNSFLGSRDVLYGFHILDDLLHGREWDESGHFPRVTMCDFEVKVLGNVHRHTVQCVLMINMFNEKIFLFLWFWYFLLMAATVCSLLYWIFISVVPSRRVNFVGKYLVGIEGYKMVDSQSLRRFVLNFLRHDGVFLLRMTATHAGELVCCELAKTLWNNFCDNKEKMHEI